MEHLNTHTTDGAQINLDALYKICPSCFTETKDENGELRKVVDFTKLRALLGDNTNDGAPESYDFTWVGKRAAQREAAAPISKTLRPCPEESVDWDNTKNLYIEGDNLEVLKLLQNSYMGKVKMIYIDPPYNTGNDFVYHDDFSVSADEYEDASGNVNEAGERFRKNTDSNGRFHSDWCSMMYARLLVARSLLREDGVILISIDDCEIENLRKICDLVFGEANFIAQMVWQGGKMNVAKFISTSHEYVLFYAKSTSYCSQIGVEWREQKRGLQDIYSEEKKLRKKYGTDYFAATKELKQWFKTEASSDSKEHDHYCNIDDKGLFCMDNVSRVGGGKYSVINPINGMTIAPPSRGWVYGKQEDFWKAYEAGIIVFQDNDKLPIFKRYLHDNEKQLLDTVFYKDRRGAKIRLRELMGGEYFDFPKDETVIKNFINSFTDSDSLILDFFSGSATTAQSVIELSKDNKRKFILVQLPEQTDKASEAYKAGYKNICEIGKERIRRAGAKIKAENPNVDTGFRVFKCDESNYKDVYLNPSAYQQEELDLFLDNIKDDRTDLDLLFDCMLRWGVELSLPMTQTKADGCTIHNVNDGDLVACFDGVITDKVIDAIAEMNPLRIVFRDSSFEEASEKMNLYELFKQKCGWSEQEVKNNVRVI